MTATVLRPQAHASLIAATPPLPRFSRRQRLQGIRPARRARCSHHRDTRQSVLPHQNQVCLSDQKMTHTTLLSTPSSMLRMKRSSRTNEGSRRLQIPPICCGQKPSTNTNQAVGALRLLLPRSPVMTTLYSGSPFSPLGDDHRPVERAAMKIASAPGILLRPIMALPNTRCRLMHPERPFHRQRAALHTHTCRQGLVKRRSRSSRLHLARPTWKA